MGSSNSTLVQKKELPPSSYSLKIQNFSQFEQFTVSSDNKYQSRFFSSAGYNWKLIVYPKGNSKDNGNGFISIYVEIESTSFLESTKPIDVFAELRFFVYNKKENKYFTIQEVEAKRFNALRLVRGLAKFLPYDTFINPANGFMFDGGQCEFGVDVIVASPLANWEILSFDESLGNPKFSCTLKKFSKLKKNFYESEIFSIGGKEWYLKLYWKDNSSPNPKWLSIFVFLADNEALGPNVNVFMEGYVQVRDPFGSSHMTRHIKTWFKRDTSWGWPEFLSLAKVQTDYLDKKDSLTIEVEFKIVSATKYSLV